MSENVKNMFGRCYERLQKDGKRDARIVHVRLYPGEDEIELVLDNKQVWTYRIKDVFGD